METSTERLHTAGFKISNVSSRDTSATRLSKNSPVSKDSEKFKSHILNSYKSFDSYTGKCYKKNCVRPFRSARLGKKTYTLNKFKRIIEKELISQEVGIDFNGVFKHQ